MSESEVREGIPGALLSFPGFCNSFVKPSYNRFYEQLHPRTVFQRKKMGRINLLVSNSHLSSVHPMENYLFCYFGCAYMNGSQDILYLKSTENLQGVCI